MIKLSEITSPAQLRGLSERELQELAGEIRTEIIHTVGVNGGHLASNLGVVELTLALHRVLNCPRDKLIFDVGHQCYAHKMLTGRYARFSTLRKIDGLSGFPCRAESEYDAFGGGHASASISAALGMARARDQLGQDYAVVVVVGDGALTGGMCYEALNDAGSRKTPLLVVLNDNGMSISRNVGALSAHLTKLRLSRGWLGAKNTVALLLRKSPVGGEILHDWVLRLKNRLRGLFVRDKFFTSLGFRYFGPVDGHDRPGLEMIIARMLKMQEPVVLHVATQKGAGFMKAERQPEKYHGVPPAAHCAAREETVLGRVAGEHLLKRAEKDPRICVITAAMTESTGFGSFAARFPERLSDVGIAEEHAATLAAGMAAAGLRPFVAIYETFLQRAIDQITVDVCLQKLPVCFLMDRAGLGGEDGATHHGVFGVPFLRGIPNLTLLSPRCEGELRAMIDWALAHPGPTAIRYPRQIVGLSAYTGNFAPGKWEWIREGGDAAVIAYSGILEEAMDAAERLAARGVSLAVINASSLKPLDADALSRLSGSNTPYFTLEEAWPSAGLGGEIAHYCAENKLRPPEKMLGLPDAFIAQGERRALLARCGLTGEQIADQIQKAVCK